MELLSCEEKISFSTIMLQCNLITALAFLITLGSLHLILAAIPLPVCSDYNNHKLKRMSLIFADGLSSGGP